MNPDTPPNEEREQKINFMTEAMLFFGKLQTEISCALVLDPKINAQLQRDLQVSEEVMEKEMDAATIGFIKQMPRATMTRSSMWGRAAAFHSNITGNPEMHEILEEVNRRIMDRVIDDHH